MIIFCGFELEKSNWVKHKYTVGEPAEGSLTLLTIRDVNFTRGQKRIPQWPVLGNKIFDKVTLQRFRFNFVKDQDG